MKQTFFLAVTVLFFTTFCYKVNAQWTKDLSINTRVTNTDKCATQLSATTSDGKTYITWYEPNDSLNYYLHIQLLNEDGNKMWGANGIAVGCQTSGSATYTYDLAVDQFDNAIIVTQYDSAGVKFKVVAYKVNTSGNQLWGADGITLGEGIGPSFAVNNKNDVFICASRKLWKVSSNGNLLWSAPLLIPDSTADIFNLISNEDNGFTTVWFSNQNFPKGINKAMRYDENGNTKWTNPVLLSSDTTQFNHQIYCIPDNKNGFYAAYTLILGDYYNVIAQKIDNAGNKPWGINGIKISDDTTSQYFLRGIEYIPTNKELWFIVQHTDADQNMFGTIAQKIDSSGSRLLGNNGKELAPLDSNFMPNGIRNVNDGLIYFYFINTGFQIMAEKIDYEGNSLWKKPVCLASSQKGFDLSIGNFNNNQVIIVWSDGRGWITDEYDVYAQNINKSGNVGPLGIPDKKVIKKINLYPNPATDKITIDCAENQKIKMQVYNMDGKCVLQEELVNRTNKIDISSLTIGMYIIKLTGDNWIAQSKLTKE